jgi:ribonuclease HII
MLTTDEMFDRDREFHKTYGPYICGVDESGRGAIAGPMVAAAVVPSKDVVPGVKDSKRLSMRRRADLYEYITEFSYACGIGIATAEEIDKYGSTWANRKVMRDAAQEAAYYLQLLQGSPVSLYLLDQAPSVEELEPQLMFPKADDTYYCVAAASILAKHTRDVLMAELADQHPEYSFENNKGYISPEHLEAAKKYGMIQGVHRFSYRVEGFTK